MTTVPFVIHRFQASLFPVNAYLIESATDVTVVDATLGRSDGQRLRAEISNIGKPLAGVIVTHALAEDLEFLMRLSVEPTRLRLALAGGSRHAH